MKAEVWLQRKEGEECFLMCLKDDLCQPFSLPFSLVCLHVVGQGCVTPLTMPVDQSEQLLSFHLAGLHLCVSKAIDPRASIQVRLMASVAVCHLSVLIYALIKCFCQWAHGGSTKDAEEESQSSPCWAWEKRKGKICSDSFKDPTWLNLARLDHGIVYTLSDTLRKTEKNNQTQSWYEPRELQATK